MNPINKFPKIVVAADPIKTINPEFGLAREEEEKSRDSQSSSEEEARKEINIVLVRI